MVESHEKLTGKAREDWFKRKLREWHPDKNLDRAVISTKVTAAGDRFDRSRGRSIESIDSIDSIIFRSLAKFLKNRSRRDDRFRQKIVKIRAILAIFRPFEDFGDFRFDRFDIFFDSIDTEPNDRWGPPC